MKIYVKFKASLSQTYGHPKETQRSPETFCMTLQINACLA